MSPAVVELIIDTAPFCGWLQHPGGLSSNRGQSVLVQWAVGTLTLFSNQFEVKLLTKRKVVMEQRKLSEVSKQISFGTVQDGWANEDVSVSSTNGLDGEPPALASSFSTDIVWRRNAICHPRA